MPWRAKETRPSWFRRHIPVRGVAVKSSRSGEVSDMIS
ncbi:Uncharacterised protein [Mycobacterium tuberculosis]|nr:Uncharacterised protein [Mycobacterium tuberculosis]